MTYHAVERIVRGALGVAVAVLLASFLVVTPATRARLPQDASTAIAAACIAAPFVVFAAFTFLQSLPGGRTAIRIRSLGSPDGWLLVFVLLIIGPKERLADLAGSYWGAAESGISLSLVVGTLATIARVVQLNLGIATDSGRSWPGR